MGTSGQGLGCGISPTLGELSLELSGHSLNGGTWSLTKKMNHSRTGGLDLGLGAIFRENGGTWLVTKYLTLGKIRLRHLVSYQDISISPRLGLGM